MPNPNLLGNTGSGDAERPPSTPRDLLIAMRRWLRAEREREAAVRSCREDASYFCSREIEAEEQAADAFAEALTAWVEAKVGEKP